MLLGDTLAKPARTHDGRIVMLASNMCSCSDSTIDWIDHAEPRQSEPYGLGPAAHTESDAATGTYRKSKLPLRGPSLR